MRKLIISPRLKELQKEAALIAKEKAEEAYKETYITEFAEALTHLIEEERA